MITYRIGNAARPPETNAVIVHIVNDIGAWGGGFTAELDRVYNGSPGEFYREWASEGLHLGRVRWMSASPDVVIVNLCAQRGVGMDRRRVDYRALQTCLAALAHRVTYARTIPTFHMPRIGCGLGGGRWEDVEPIIRAEMDNLPVFVYDLAPDSPAR